MLCHGPSKAMVPESRCGSSTERVTMGYSAADESFTHQFPAPFDQVHDPDPTWSDRCYFFAASPDGEMLLASGYGNNPNTGTGLGYVKVSLADGRHWDLLSGRPVTGAD